MPFISQSKVQPVCPYQLSSQAINESDILVRLNDCSKYFCTYHSKVWAIDAVVENVNHPSALPNRALIFPLCKWFLLIFQSVSNKIQAVRAEINKGSSMEKKYQSDILACYNKVSKNSLIVAYFTFGYSCVPSAPLWESMSKYVWSPFTNAEYMKIICMLSGYGVSEMRKHHVLLYHLNLKQGKPNKPDMG
jgi:hypothetical protein